jgi:hypothetical protein
LPHEELGAQIKPQALVPSLTHEHRYAMACRGDKEGRKNGVP